MGFLIQQAPVGRTPGGNFEHKKKSKSHWIFFAQFAQL
jgi:hypothetical protein